MVQGVSVSVRVSPVMSLMRPKMSKYRNCIYWGIRIIWEGTRIIMMTMPNRRFLPLNLNRAKPYPVREQVTTCTREQPIFSSRVLSRVGPKFITFSTSLMG